MFKKENFVSYFLLSLGILLVTSNGVHAEFTSSDNPLNLTFHEFEEPNLSSGDFSMSIPFEAPEGIGGLKPSIALQYNSAAGNGVAGMGWSFNLSCIERFSAPKDVKTTDGNDDTLFLGRGDVNEEPNQSLYYLDGQRLVACDGSEECPQAYDDNFSYQINYSPVLNNASLLTQRIDVGPPMYPMLAAWEMKTLEGLTINYGSRGEDDFYTGRLLEDAREVEIFSPTEIFVFDGQGKRSVKWCATRITNGTYKSTGDGLAEVLIDYENGLTAPSTITWDPDFRMEFQYEGRSDVDESMAAPARHSEYRRWKSVDIYKGQTLLRRYEARYETGIQTGVSRLAAVVMKDKDNSACRQDTGSADDVWCPIWSAEYGDFDPGESMYAATSNIEAIPRNANNPGTRLMDINGDGLPDYVSYWGDWNNDSYSSTLEVYLATGSGWAHTPEASAYEAALAEMGQPFSINHDPRWADEGVRSGDFDGNGYMDFLQIEKGASPHTRLWLQRRNESGTQISFDLVYENGMSNPEFDLGPLADDNMAVFSEVHWNISNEHGWLVADLDGDGLTDVFGGSAYHQFVEDEEFPIQHQFYARTDSNGKVVRAAYLNRGDHFIRNDRFAPPQPFAVAGGYRGSRKNLLGVMVADVNGDHFPDIIQAGPHLDLQPFVPEEYKVQTMTRVDSERNIQYKVWLNGNSILTAGYMPYFFPDHTGSVWIESEAYGQRLQELMDGKSFVKAASIWAAGETYTTANWSDYRDGRETSGDDLGYRFKDVNGDHKADILFSREGSVKMALISDYDNLWVSDSRYLPTIRFKEETNDGKYFQYGDAMDFNGDGFTDMVPRDGRAFMNRLAEVDSEGYLAHPVDLLTKVGSPMGGRQTIKYKRLKSGHGEDDFVNYHRMPQPKVVVAEIEVSDGRSGGSVSVPTQYEYFGGKYDRVRRRFSGFRYVRATKAFPADEIHNGNTSPRTLMTESWFHQDWCLSGQLQASLVSGNNNPDESHHYTLPGFGQSDPFGPAYDTNFDFLKNNDEQLLAWKTLSYLNVHNPSAPSSCNDVAQSPIFVPLTRKVSVQYGQDESTLVKTGTTESYDYYPTFGLMRESALVDNIIYGTAHSDLSPMRRTEKVYAKNLSAWQVRPCEEKLYLGNEMTVSRAVKKRYSSGFNCSLPLPSQGNPKLAPLGEKIEGGGLTQEQSFSYDKYGNQTRHTKFVGTEIPLSIMSFYRDPNQVHPDGMYLFEQYTLPDPGTGTTNLMKRDIVRSSEYDQFGRLTSRYSGQRVRTHYDYDSYHRLIRTEQSDNDGVLKSWSSIEYGGIPGNYADGSNSTANWQHVLRKSSFNLDGLNEGGPSELASKEWVDGLGRSYRTVSVNGMGDQERISVVKTYNSLGKVASVTHPFFAASDSDAYQPDHEGVQTEYDVFGRIQHTSGAGVPTVDYGYSMDSNAQGVRTRVTTTNTNGANSDRFIVKDTLGRTVLTAECKASENGSCGNNPRGSEYVQTKHDYDAFDQLRQTTLNDNSRMVMSYDRLGRKTWMIDPNMSNCEYMLPDGWDFNLYDVAWAGGEHCNWSYFYDDRGNLAQQVDGKGQTTNTRFDMYNRETWKFTCDENGKLDALSNFEYDHHRPNKIWQERHLVFPYPYGSPRGYFAGVQVSLNEDGSKPSCPLSLQGDESVSDETNPLNMKRYIRHNEFGEIETKDTQIQLSRPELGLDVDERTIIWTDYGAAGQVRSSVVNLYDTSQEQVLSYNYGRYGHLTAYDTNATCYPPISDITYDASGRVTHKTMTHMPASGDCNPANIGNIGDVSYDYFDANHVDHFNRLSKITFSPSEALGANSALEIKYSKEDGTPGYDTFGNINFMKYTWGVGGTDPKSYKKAFAYDRLGQLTRFGFYDYQSNGVSVPASWNPEIYPDFAWDVYLYSPLGNREYANVKDYGSHQPDLPAMEAVRAQPDVRSFPGIRPIETKPKKKSKRKATIDDFAFSK